LICRPFWPSPACWPWRGLATGVLAGIFGVGGGAISVPILFFAFGLIGVEDAIAMPMAVGTSLAIIIPTSIKSARGHYAKGAVDMAIVRAWAVPVLLGVSLGAAWRASRNLGCSSWSSCWSP
jgi:uncharacterized protein